MLHRPPESAPLPGTQAALPARSARKRRFLGYVARGVPYGPDDGTLAPWAVVASLPFAPEIVLPPAALYGEVPEDGKRVQASSAVSIRHSRVAVLEVRAGSRTTTSRSIRDRSF